MPHRGRWVSAGIGLGAVGAAAVAAGVGIIARFAHGNGQEIFEAGVLFAAGLMLAWHNVYMAHHGRELTHKLKTMGAAVLAGRASLVMLVGVTALAVMREGSEIALFLYGIAASGVKGLSLLGGSLVGLAAGVVVGFVLFAGLSRIPMKRLFQVSGWIILFIAAGMIARGAEFLIQAGYLPALVARVWDSSFLIEGNSLLGRSLGALAGYTPSPSLMQILFWVGSFAVIGGLMIARPGSSPSARPETGAAREAGAAMQSQRQTP
jgi:high-affinity iron transporter